MATDLETGTDQGEPASARPSLKITGLHIRGLKSIESLDLPEDGLGWGASIPDFVMVGGINGSGKTTLLEFLVGAFSLCGRDLLCTNFLSLPSGIRAEEARVDFQLSLPEIGVPQFVDVPIRVLIGESEFLDKNAKGPWFGIEHGDFLSEIDAEHGSRGYEDHIYEIKSLFTTHADDLGRYGCPSVVYFPSERRTLISPPTEHKFAGKLSKKFVLVNRWDPPGEWGNSLEARLYGIRWEDLNAKEEGRHHEANGFESYARAFHRFFEGRKHIRWRRGELIVETNNKVKHDLSELSSGEKQVILFMGELLHRWRPGSIILIDEPELHLHEYYQTRLWEALVDWQKERGGQVILATQSDHLFGLSGLGTRLILRGWPR